MFFKCHRMALFTPCLLITSGIGRGAVILKYTLAQGSLSLTAPGTFQFQYWRVKGALMYGCWRQGCVILCWVKTSSNESVVWNGMFSNKIFNMWSWNYCRFVMSDTVIPVVSQLLESYSFYHILWGFLVGIHWKNIPTCMHFL